jgi:hypothetical protein
MTLLGIIDLYFGPDPSSGNKFNGWQLLYTFVGSLGALGIAYLVFKWNQDFAKQKHETDKAEIRDEKYLFFTMMISQIPDIVDSQIKIYKDHVKSLKKPFVGDYTAATRQTITTLKRIYESNDNEQYLHSFIKLVNLEDPKKKTNLFLDIYSCVDMMYLTLTRHYDFLDKIFNRIQEAYSTYSIVLRDLEFNLVEAITNPEFPKKWPKEHDIISKIFFGVGEKPQEFDTPVKELLPPLIYNFAGPPPSESDLVRTILIKVKKVNEAYQEFQSIIDDEIENHINAIESLSSENSILKRLITNF